MAPKLASHKPEERAMSGHKLRATVQVLMALVLLLLMVT